MSLPGSLKLSVIYRWSLNQDEKKQRNSPPNYDAKCHGEKKRDEETEDAVVKI